MNDDKSSGDTTLTYKKGGGGGLSPSKCLHPKRVYESNGFPESLDKMSFRSAKIISSMYTYKPAIKVAIHTCIIMHNTLLRSAFLAQRMEDLSKNQDNAP